jgi:hypothetical protein
VASLHTSSFSTSVVMRFPFLPEREPSSGPARIMIATCLPGHITPDGVIRAITPDPIAATCRSRGSLVTPGKRSMPWRNGRDSNPRAFRPAAFKATAIVRSATVPPLRLPGYTAWLQERCQSGRMGRPAKALIAVMWSVGSNPTLSARCVGCSCFKLGHSIRREAHPHRATFREGRRPTVGDNVAQLRPVSRRQRDWSP